MNIPKIRFNYTGEWDKYPLSDLLKERKKRTKISEDYPLYSFAAGQGVIRKEDRKTNNRDFLTYDFNTKSYLITKYDDIVYNPANLKYGAIDRNKLGQGLISPIYVTFTTDQNPKYMEYLLKREKFIKNALQFEEGTVVKRKAVNPKDLLSIKEFVPKKDEQEKIGNFFELIDNEIALIENKAIELTKLKKCIIDSVINSIEAESVSLSDILKERKTFSEKGLEYPHVTLSKEGIYDKGERYNRDFLVTSDDKKYKITLLNDLCYNPANLKFGVICLNEYGSAIFSPIYVTFEIDNKVNPLFIKYYCCQERFINKARKYEQGTVSARTAVSPDDFLKMKIKLPSKTEQDSIVEKIKNIEELIEQEYSKKAEYLKLKTGLLQQMFI